MFACSSLAPPDEVVELVKYEQSILLPSTVVVSPANFTNEHRLFASLYAGIQDIEQPDVKFSEVIELPGKDAPLQDWFKWGLSLIILVLYNVFQKRRHTNKSWTVLGMLYRFFNTMHKDKGFNGNLEIKRE